jgi:hypothetical protein
MQRQLGISPAAGISQWLLLVTWKCSELIVEDNKTGKGGEKWAGVRLV